MNQKTARKYELISACVSGEGDTAKHLTELVAIDFDTAFDMYEYALGAGKSIASVGLDILMKASESKTRAMFCESLPLQKLIFSSSEAVAPNIAVFLGNLIISGKLDTAEECLQKLRGNTHIDFNDSMKVVLDTTFAVYCQKNNVRVPVLNKKQKTLLQSYIDKVKGSNKALMLQRIKEL